MIDLPLVTDTMDLRDDYLTLLERSLLAMANGPLEIYKPVSPKEGSFLRRKLQSALVRRGNTLLAWKTVIDVNEDPDGKRFVYALPPGIMTMVGQTRLENARDCLIEVIKNDVPGDVIETGVWRGGTVIFLRGILKAYGDTKRSVYVADSFEGLPPPDADKYPADEGLTLNEHVALAVGLEAVKANFERYGLLDDRVVFVKGWFRDTLPGLKDHQWSLIRLDGDLYESTWDALTNLYPSLSPGGWVIIDDYEIPACAQAVTDYRRQNGITEEMIEVDWSGRCWKKKG
jgi:O-methyltransferase